MEQSRQQFVIVGQEYKHQNLPSGSAPDQQKKDLK
jgi:hypothetical protein